MVRSEDFMCRIEDVPFRDGVDHALVAIGRAPGPIFALLGFLCGLFCFCTDVQFIQFFGIRCWQTAHDYLGAGKGP